MADTINFSGIASILNETGKHTQPSLIMKVHNNEWIECILYYALNAQKFK